MAVDGSHAIAKDEISINLDSTSMKSNIIKLEKALVGKLLGKKLPYLFLVNNLKHKWGSVGNFKLIMITPDCFICIFDMTEARDAILMNGLWFLLDNIIGLDRWSPNLDPKALDGLSSLVWVRLPKLSLMYWDNTFIALIASFLKSFCGLIIKPLNGGKVCMPRCVCAYQPCKVASTWSLGEW